MSMFAIGPNAPTAVESLLNYGSKLRRFGLCSYASWYAPVDHDSHRDTLQRLIEADSKRTMVDRDEPRHSYPVEFALLASVSSNSAEDIYDEAAHTYHKWDNKADKRAAHGQLRIWWAYNLAVVLSNTEEEVDKVGE